MIVRLTGRQWHALTRIPRRLEVHHTAQVIAFRPRDVVVTDGHRIFVAPLPEDPGRDLAISAVALRPWIHGFKRCVDSFVLEQVEPTSVSLTREIDGARAPALHLRTVDRIPDAVLDAASRVDLDQAPGPFFLNPQYTDEARCLHRAFGISTTGGVRVCHALHGDATGFVFETLHGPARYVVMRLAGSVDEAREIEQRRSTHRTDGKANLKSIPAPATPDELVPGPAPDGDRS